MPIRLHGIRTLLSRHGRDFTLTSTYQGEYNPENGEFTDDPNQDTYIIRGYFYDSKELNIENTQIENGKRKLILLATDILGYDYPKPEPGMTVYGQNDSVSIARVEEIRSGEQVIFYICQAQE